LDSRVASTQGLDPETLGAELADISLRAEEMARVAIAGLHVSPEKLNQRERVFASTLLRHARGVKAAVAAWQQERAPGNT
jgi:hypothetical protein